MPPAAGRQVRVAHSTAQCQARGFSATSIRASQRPQRSVHRSSRVPRPVTKLGVPLSSPGASHIRKEPDKLVGWEVLLEQGGARSGQVQSILGGPLSSTLLRVYGPGWGRSATQILPDSELGDSGNGNAIHLIPLAEGIVHRVDVEGRRLFIKPPEGLLELSQRRMLLEWLDSQLEELAAEMANPRDLQAGRRPYMPTREQLKASGNSHLIPAIQSAGGFLEVAFELNFRHRRRPSGYWDNMDTLDQEISRFVASNWVELSDTYSDTVYFYNQITGRVCETEPTLPTVETSTTRDNDGMAWIINEDPNDRVMPSAREICSAGRYDLHHGIVYNGGYRAVARELHRPPSYPRAKPQSLEELAEELMAIMEEEELGDRVPTPSLLYDIGKQHLLKNVYDMGGFPTVVELMAEELGMDVRTRRRAGHWDDIENVVREMREFMDSRPGQAKARAAGESSKLAGREQQQQQQQQQQQFLPTHRELLAAGRPDLRYALQKHGHMEIARELGVAVNPRGRPRKCRPEPDDSEDVNEEHMHIYR